MKTAAVRYAVEMWERYIFVELRGDYVDAGGKGDSAIPLLKGIFTSRNSQHFIFRFPIPQSE